MKNNSFLMNALHLFIILVQVLVRAGFTCDKNFEATYFRARKFVPVCVTCASTDNLIGVIIENVQRNGRQEILLPQCQTCIDNPDIRSVVCPHIKSNAIFRGFTPIGNVRQVVPVRNSLPVRPQCPAALHGCNLGPRNEDLPLMVLSEIDLSSEETENGDEVQTSVLQIPDFNQFKDLRALKLKVPCVTWGDGGRLLFECDDEFLNTKMCDGEVIRVVKPKRGERYPTFHVGLKRLTKHLI